MSRHRAVHRHAGPRRWIGARHTPRHATGATQAAPPVAARSLAELVAGPAPGLDVRPVDARPRGPRPYEHAPPTQPWRAIEGAAT